MMAWEPGGQASQADPTPSRYPQEAVLSDVPGLRTKESGHRLWSSICWGCTEVVVSGWTGILLTIPAAESVCRVQAVQHQAFTSHTHSVPAGAAPGHRPLSAASLHISSGCAQSPVEQPPHSEMCSEAHESYSPCELQETLLSLEGSGQILPLVLLGLSWHWELRGHV